MMNITIPDKTFKLLIYVGLIIAGVSAYALYKLDLDDEKNYIEVNKIINNSNKTIDENNFEIDIIKDKYKEDSSYVIERKGFKEVEGVEKLVSTEYINVISPRDSLFRKLNDQFALKLLKGKSAVELAENSFDEKKYRIESRVYSWYIFFVFGIVMSAIGYGKWEAYERKLEKVNTPFHYHRCQSCGLDFDSIRRPGTNQDSSSNTGICSECINDGVFTNLELTKSKAFTEYKRRTGLKVNKRNEKLERKSFYKLDRWRIND